MQHNLVVVVLQSWLNEKSTSQEIIQVWPIYKFLVLAQKTSRLRHLVWGLYCNHISRICNAEALRAREFLVFLKFHMNMMWCESVTGWWLLLLVFDILKSLFESEDHQYGSAFWNLPKRQWNWQKYIVFLAWHISFFVDERCLAIAPS